MHRDGTPQCRTHRRVGLAREKSISYSTGRGTLQEIPKVVETAENLIRLDTLVTGSRLVVRSKKDWRFAAVSKMDEGRVVLTVASPSGHSYRLRRDPDTEILLEGTIPILKYDETDTWRDNLGQYDVRW